jgi:hypothetical protein
MSTVYDQNTGAQSPIGGTASEKSAFEGPRLRGYKTGFRAADQCAQLDTHFGVDTRTFDQNISGQTSMGGCFCPYYSHEGSFPFDRYQFTVYLKYT